MDLRLQSRSDRDQLGSVAHQLPQFAGLRRSDPRLGQPAHPQQIGQITGVAYIVFHPPVAESLDPQRMRQMHPRSAGLQHIDGPIPAVGRFEHHLGIRTRPARAASPSATGSLTIRTADSCSPDSDWRTITDRRRCRSIPTNCLPSYSSIGASLGSWK